MTAEQIGTLVWLLLCIVVGFREIYCGLPEVRERVRAGKGTEEDLKRLKKKKLLGLAIIIGPGFCLSLPDLLPLLIH